VLRRAIWLETDKQYGGIQALIKIKTARMKVETAERAPDFRVNSPHFHRTPASIAVDASLGRKVRAYTKSFRASTAIINSIITFTAQAQNAYQVTSEGTQLQFGQNRYRLELFIQAKRRTA